jgi:hypothetical protein
MTAPLKPEKKTVELNPEVRPSRIRRDPVIVKEAAAEAKGVRWRTNEQEIAFAIVGIVLFAIAINIIVVAVSAYTN